MYQILGFVSDDGDDRLVACIFLELHYPLSFTLFWIEGSSTSLHTTHFLFDQFLLHLLIFFIVINILLDAVNIVAQILSIIILQEANTLPESTCLYFRNYSLSWLLGESDTRFLELEVKYPELSLIFMLKLALTRITLLNCFFFFFQSFKLLKLAMFVVFVLQHLCNLKPGSLQDAG